MDEVSKALPRGQRKAQGALIPPAAQRGHTCHSWFFGEDMRRHASKSSFAALRMWLRLKLKLRAAELKF